MSVSRFARPELWPRAGISQPTGERVAQTQRVGARGAPGDRALDRTEQLASRADFDLSLPGRGGSCSGRLGSEAAEEPIESEGEALVEFRVGERCGTAEYVRALCSKQ